MNPIPCFNCGSTSVTILKSFDYKYYVFCLGCGNKTDDYSSIGDAAKAWNSHIYKSLKYPGVNA